MPKRKGHVKNKPLLTADSDSFARLILKKSVDLPVTYINHVISYSIVVNNTGSTFASNVIITDAIPAGTVLVPNSMIVSVPYTPLPGGAVALTNPIAADEIVIINFKLLVTAIPNPNPIINTASADYTFNQTSATAQSNAVTTTVFRYNFSQQISDLIEFVALEQAALAAIANAEGAKIQRIAAIQGITPQRLLCLNRSVNDMMDSIAMLEAVLRQKLNIVNCQINGEVCCIK